jgi:hypothetical protein
VEQVLEDNEVVEVCEDDDRVRYVLLGHVAQRPLHVVVAVDDIVASLGRTLRVRAGRGARLGSRLRIPWTE